MTVRVLCAPSRTVSRTARAMACFCCGVTPQPTIKTEATAAMVVGSLVIRSSFPQRTRLLVARFSNSMTAAFPERLAGWFEFSGL